ncbi:winged helix-turn-helix transcriptional regulator [Paenibacillus alkalitolerans]|uniref:winged helix-turn-helix transcriptional regulator n=1 Tax=Paenibacillus alkalitolerans TaxID=2799335 RepID=UPI0018F79B5A|nr:winged helix-turn-helix transcriptional regulator [Paenibacillus alkalitolerans]
MQLRELEESRIVQRTIFASVPPKVEYALTEFGKSLEPILERMVEAGEHYVALKKKETNDT